MAATLRPDGVTRPDSSRRLNQRALLSLELVTGVLALLGGMLLVIAPDGSLLGADPAVLNRTPFPDWRVPGILLAILVGVGFLLSALALRFPFGTYLSIAAGLGLVAFEVVEFLTIGFQPLEAVFAVVGMLVVVLAASIRTPGT